MPIFSLATLRTKVLGRLDSNSALYTTPEVDAAINEAVRVTALFTGFYGNTVEVPNFTVANQLIYSTPAGILVPIHVYFEGRQLQKLPLRKLVRMKRDWATDTTARSGPVQYWAPLGISQFVMSPKDSVGGRTVAVSGTTSPPLLVNTTDVMSLENEYVELITEYCAHRLPLKEGGKVFADASLALNVFYSKLKQRKRYESLQTAKYRVMEPRQEDAQ